MKEKKSSLPPAFEAGDPAPLPFIISLPHCSSAIPEHIRPAIALTDDDIEASTDIGTAEIFGSVPAKVILHALWSRLVVDLNRSPLDRGPRGVIAEVDYDGRPIYNLGRFPDEKEVAHRLRKYYTPFHIRLKKALTDPKIKGVLDCHSLCGTGPARAPDAGRQRSDIVLGNNGNREGKVSPTLGNTTCPPKILHFMKKVFQQVGFSVMMNHPYTGGFITTHYSREFTGSGKIFIQVEINQDLYLEADSGQPTEEKLENVRNRIFRSLEEISKAL